ncbi:MAG: stage III sporulation protein AC [Clostridia bacterium]|nr:stage III sporulation protein AC [Clostridia bacterium]
MDIGLILRVAGVGILVTVTCQILSKAGRDEQSLLVALTGMVLVLLMLVEQIGNLILAVQTVFGL